jgi:UDP-glucose 4-epimerase
MQMPVLISTNVPQQHLAAPLQTHNVSTLLEASAVTVTVDSLRIPSEHVLTWMNVILLQLTIAAQRMETNAATLTLASTAPVYPDMKRARVSTH